MPTDEPIIVTYHKCGRKLEFVPQYLRYFKEYQNTFKYKDQQPQLVCPDCGKEIKLPKVLPRKP